MNDGKGSTQKPKTSKYGSIDTSEENKQAEEIINQACCRCSFIIEPVVLFANFAINIQYLAFSQFVYTRILNRLIENQPLIPINSTNSTSFYEYSYYHDLTKLKNKMPLFTNNDHICRANSSFRNSSTDTSSDFDQLVIEAQKESAHFLFMIALIGGIPCIFTTNLLGINSTKLGRKFLLSINIFVMIIIASIYLAISINPKLPDYLFYICAAMDGLSGSASLLYLISHCYVADLVSEKSRSYRITLINYTDTITCLVIAFGCGYVIKYLGYVYIFASGLFFTILAFLYLIIIVPEPLAEVRSKPLYERIKSCSIVRFKNSFQILFRKNHPIYLDGELNSTNTEETSRLLNQNEHEEIKLGERQHSVIVIIIVAHLTFCVAASGMDSILTLFLMNKPFCWDSVNISSFTLYTSVFAIICSLYVSKFLKINDIIICIMSVSSYISCLFCFAYAKSSLGIYIGGSVAAINGLEFSYVRSFVSKLITKHEITDAITLVSCFDTLTAFLGATLFPLIYENTVEGQIRFMFFVMIGFFTICLLLFILALRLFKKSDQIREVENDDELNDENSSTENASIENIMPVFPASYVPRHADSISLYNSLVIANHEKDEKFTLSV